jgi:NTP pyrophosphatase (non-canonical NTP hydrolase)
MPLEEIKNRSRKIFERFAKIEPRRWTIEGATMELVTEVGDLTELILRKEYYKQNIYEDLDYQIRDELSDVLLVLMRIADYYKIDLDKAYAEMEDLMDDRLKNRGV